MSIELPNNIPCTDGIVKTSHLRTVRVMDPWRRGQNDPYYYRTQQWVHPEGAFDSGHWEDIEVITINH